jgi:hypothetical protein
MRLKSGFKTRLMGSYKASTGSYIKRVNLGQYKNKIDYYHGFKTWLESRPETRFKSQVGRVNLIDLFFFKKITFFYPKEIQENSTGFKSVFLSCVNPSFWPGHVESIISLFFKLRPTQSLVWPDFRLICQVSSGFIDKVIIILLNLTLNIN